jgi:ABC-type transport system involved in multi-copper enzyme maturation permease subunit
MANAKEVLSPEDYTNYRNVRAASLLFVVFGLILFLGGIAAATEKRPNPQPDIPPAVIIAMAVIGLAGAVGGLAALLGSRRWAKLAYVMAVPWLLGFPIGTIMSYVVLSGLSRYLDSKERIGQATIESA